MLTKNPRSKWSNESLEAIMDAIEIGITSLHGPNKFYGKLVTSFSNYLYGKTRSRKIGPPCVLTKEQDGIIIVWVLSMQECGLSITL